MLRTQDSFEFVEDLDGRWVTGGPKRWMRSAIEFRGDDVDKSEPPGMFIVRADPALIQDYLGKCPTWRSGCTLAAAAIRRRRVANVLCNRA